MSVLVSESIKRVIINVTSCGRVTRKWLLGLPLQEIEISAMEDAAPSSLRVFMKC